MSVVAEHFKNFDITKRSTTRWTEQYILTENPGDEPRREDIHRVEFFGFVETIPLPEPLTFHLQPTFDLTIKDPAIRQLRQQLERQLEYIFGDDRAINFAIVGHFLPGSVFTVYLDEEKVMVSPENPQLSADIFISLDLSNPSQLTVVDAVDFRITAIVAHFCFCRSRGYPHGLPGWYRDRVSAPFCDWINEIHRETSQERLPEKQRKYWSETFPDGKFANVIGATGQNFINEQYAIVKRQYC